MGGRLLLITLIATTVIHESWTCHESQFMCKNGKCISRAWHCDSEDDCGDGSDEDRNICDNQKCSETEFKCNNGRCIPMSWLCDSANDCGDGTDENPNNCRPHETTPTSHVLITPETTTTLPHTIAKDLLSTTFSRGSTPETPPLIYDVTTIYRLAEPLPSTTETRGVNVQGALNHPGTVEVHARTNARGLPFRLEDGTIRGPKVGVSVPDCLQETQNCSWTPKNFTMTKPSFNSMSLWTFDARENFVLKASQYTEARPFHSSLWFTFDTTREKSNCDERCYLAVFLIAHGGNVNQDDMYYMRIRHQSEGPTFLTKCTPHSFDLNYYLTEDATRRCEKKGEVKLEWDFTPGTPLSFTVSFTNGRIILKASRHKEHITLFDWIDSDPIAISNVVFGLSRLEGIVRSKTDVYPFLEQTEETGTITSPSLSPGLDKLCVSLVFYTDKEANIEVQLQHDNSLSTVWELNSGQQSLTQNSEWAHKNILVNIPSGTIGEMAAVIRATKRAGSTVLIQTVAGCNAQEQEDVLVLSEEASITVTSPGIDIAHNFIYKNAEENTCKNGGLNLIEQGYNLTTQQGGCICPAGFTGDNCEIACGANSYGLDCEGVCSESKRECRGMVLCRPEIGCNCAPGYKGLHCITPCEEGEYGAGCHQTCGKCVASSCDVYTGVCHQGCVDGHYPPLCKEVYVHITRTPWVVVNSFHSASVSANLINLNGQGEPRYYQVQVKEENEFEWRLEVPQPIPVKKPEKLLTPSLTKNFVSLGHVKDLKPGTPYLLRVVLIDRSGAIYQGEQVPSASFSTPCTVPNKADYIMHNKNLGFLDIVAVHDDGFEIGWQFPTEPTTWCPVIGYEVNVKMGWQWQVYKVPAAVIRMQVRDLLPGRKYTVKVRAVTSRGPAAFSPPRMVTTLDQTPDYVVDLKEGEITQHSVTATWSPPRQPAGTLRRYHVTYKCLRLMGCPQEDCSSSADHIEVMTTSVLLDGLLPHAMYNISVAGESGALGPASSLVTATIPGAPDVAPLFARPAVLSRSNTSLTVQWAPPASCARLNGYLRGYRYELVTPEQQLPLLVGTTTNYSVTFNNLKPDTDYMVRVFVESSTGWNKTYGLEIASKTRDTRSEVVKNLTVYKRGRRMVGLRWSPPGRTYGSLQSFTITHKPLTGSGKPISVTVKPSLCPAWNQLYCHTINNLKPDTEYTIAVQALNTKSTKSSEEASNEIITRIVHDEGASIAEHDILTAIKIPFGDPKTQFFENGFEGFPAFGLKPGSDVKSPYRLFLPEKFYGDFSIYATIHTNSSESAFLFSVVNPLETVVQLGVQISPAGAYQPNNMNISLIYTDVNSHLSSQTVASFTVPSFVNKWTRFVLKVTKEYVTLFLNCQELGTVVLKRTPQELVFEPLSLLYVGQAGPLIKEAFDGALQELKIFGSASVAHLQCAKSIFKEEPDRTDATEVGDEVTINATTKEGAPEAPSYLRVKNQTDVSLAVEWGLPDMINGNLRSFLVNIEETDSVNSSDCCAYFPIREIIVKSEHSVYEFQTTDLKPASSYEVSVSAKTVAMGPALTLTGHTRPPIPVLKRAPRVAEPVVVGKPLVVQVEPTTEYPDQLISGYLLLLEAIGNSEYEKTIKSELLLTPNKSFALLAEFTQSELPDGGKFEIQPDRPMVKGRFGLMGLPSMKPGSQYRLIWALVLDYCGAQSVGHVIGDIFTADLP